MNVLDPPLQVKPPKETKLEAFASKKAKFDCGLIYLPKSSATSIANRPTIRWLKNGLPLEPSSRVYTKKDLSEHLNDDEHEKEEILFEGRRIKLDDLVSSQLVISSTIRSDSGYYQCFVENQYESLTSEFYLYVNPINNQPLPPRNLMVNIIGSSEAIVNWSVPMSLSEILGYTVHYQSVSNKMKIKEEKAVTNNNFYHLTNLSPYTNYTLFVRAYSQQNASNDSKVITFLTGEETPVDLPFFRASVKNKTSALLKWEELSSVDARGKILYYKIQYAEVPNVNEETKPELIRTINVEAEATEYLITSLQPGLVYRFKVIAGNSKGLPADDIVEYVDWEQIEMPLINGEQIRLNLNASAMGHDAIRVDWKVEEEGNEKDITQLLKKNIKLVCQNTFRDEDRQVFEVKRDQNSFEFVDLFESSPYMIEIEVQFEKGSLQFKESTLVKTTAKVAPKLLPEPALDNDLEQTETGSSAQPNVEPSNSIDSDVLASSPSSTSSTSSTTPEPVRLSSSTSESESNSSSSTTESINRADIDFDPPTNENPNGHLTDKQSTTNEKNDNLTGSQSNGSQLNGSLSNDSQSNDRQSNGSLPTIADNELSPYNISDNLLDDVKPNKKLTAAEEDARNDLNLFEKKAVYESDSLNRTDDERHPANSATDTAANDTATNRITANSTVTTDKAKEDEEIQRKLLIDSKILNQINSTDQTLTEQGRANESDFNVSTNGVNSTAPPPLENGSSTTETIASVDKPETNEIDDDKLNGNKESNKESSNKSIEKTSLSPVDSSEPAKRHEESVDNASPNISVDQLNENDLRKPFLKRLDKEATRVGNGSRQTVAESGQETRNRTSEQDLDNLSQRENTSSSSKSDLITDLRREEDKLMNSLDLQDNQLKSKLDLFDKTHNQTESGPTAESSTLPSLSSTSTTTTPVSTTTSTTAQPSTSTQSITADTVEMQNRINQILKRNLTSDDLLPNISEFEVVPLNGSTVNCRWKTNSLNENATFTLYYNPIRYLESNYSKNFDFDDEFLFLRTTSTELNITNLQPHTIYDFYLTISYKSLDQEDDFFYQLNKFLAKKLKNKFFVKHTKALNQTERPAKLQSLTKTQKKYEKPFRALEGVIDEFENLLAFYRGQRRRVRTLEDLPGAPTEFTGIALDASSVQLSWRSPIESNGVIRAFEILHTRNDLTSLPLDEWTAVRLEGNQFVHIVKGLNESTEYKFVVRARNGAGLGKSTPKLIICTLKENYDTYEKFLTSEPDLIETNTFKYTKYDMSVKDYLSLDESSELLVRIGIGVSVLFACIVVLAVFSNK